MSRRINESDWTTVKPRGTVHEICVSKATGEVVLLGSPDNDDEDSPDAHNCDANGCGQVHVLWRRKP